MQTTTAISYRTRAAFLVSGSWVWKTWNHHEPNKHAAILNKAAEIGAGGYETSQADHAEEDRWNYATCG